MPTARKRCNHLKVYMKSGGHRIALEDIEKKQGRRRLLKSGPAMKYQRRFTSAKGTSWGRAREGAIPLS